MKLINIWKILIVNDKKEIRKQIKELVKQYAQIEFEYKKFEPGKTSVPAAGKVIGEAELQNMVSASLDGWLTTGRFNEKFEIELAKFIGVKSLITVKDFSVFWCKMYFHYIIECV